MSQYEKVVDDTSLRWISDAWIAPEALSCESASRAQSVALVEIPFDHAVSYRPGTRLGPSAIIDALNGFSLYCTDKRVDVSSIRLCRHVVEVSNNLHDTYAAIENVAENVPKASTPFFLGGDHSITDPIIRGLLGRAEREKFGLIVFDAHFDSRPPVKGKERSGHWMYTIQNVFKHTNSVQLGINAPIYSKKYMDDAERSWILVQTPHEIRKSGWAETLKSAIAHATRDTSGIYISIDIDCLDRSFAQGTSVPNACGLMPYEVADAVYEICRQTKLIGLDIVEVSPPLDNSSNTAEVAAVFVLNALAGIVNYADKPQRR